MSDLFWLSDEAWAALEPHLPPRKQPGKPRVDDRRVISGILNVLKTGCRLWSAHDCLQLLQPLVPPPRLAKGVRRHCGCGADPG